MRVLITAGASGLGRAMAREFLASGAQVAVVDLDAEALADVRREHPEVLALQASVTDEGQMAAAFEQAIERLGGLDVVAANAGTAGPAGPVETIDVDAWRQCIDVNLTGAFITAKLAATELKAQRGGLLLFTSSTAGLFGYPNRSPYGAAKWALTGLTKTLAMELGGHGVRVNAIAPGAIEGERMERVLALEAAARGVDSEVVREQYASCVSLRTWVKAEDIANMALFLASPQGAKISGQVLAVDGHTETLSP